MLGACAASDYRLHTYSAGLGIRSLRDPARFARFAFATFATLPALGRDSGLAPLRTLSSSPQTTNALSPRDNPDKPGAIPWLHGRVPQTAVKNRAHPQHPNGKRTGV